MRRVGWALAGMASVVWGAGAACGGRALSELGGTSEVDPGPGGASGTGGATSGRGGALGRAGSATGGTGRGGAAASGSGGSAVTGGAAGNAASGRAGAVSAAGAAGAGGGASGDGSCASPLPIGGEASFGNFIPRSSSDFDACVGEGPEEVLRWTPPAAGRYIIDTIGSGFDTVLYAATSLSCDPFTPAPNGACNDDFGDYRSLVSVDVGADQEVFIVVDSYNSSGGDYLLNIRESGECPSLSAGGELGRPVFQASEFSRLVQALDPGGIDLCGGAALGVTFGWQAPAAGDYVFDTEGSDFDAVLAVREACGGALIGCDDDGGTEPGASRVARTLEAGQQVVIEIGAFPSSSQAAFGAVSFSVNPL